MKPAHPPGGSTRRLGGFSSIADGLDYAALGAGSITFRDRYGQAAATLSYAQLRQKALEYSAGLRRLGLRRGDVVILLAETTPGFICAFYGCQYAGVVPCPVQAVLRTAANPTSIEFLKRIAAESGAKVVIGPPESAGALFDALPAGIASVTFDELGSPEPTHPSEPGDICDTAYIQYSSGSTARPKGVVVTQKAVMANTDAILRHGIGLTDDDRALSWLPFHHDMGLVGFSIAPLCGQCDVDYLASSAFVRRPALWLKLISELRCTVSYSPTFGYELALQRIRPQDCEGLDLSNWRVAGIGGDMIRSDILDGFSRRFATMGFRRSAFLPSYGMAEATLAISFDRSAEGYRVEHDAEGRAFVICGAAIPGHEVIVADDRFEALPEGANGNILVRGPSVMRGYLNEADSADAFTREGYLITGDKGYLIGGDIVVTGRSKDMFLVNGRNIWPQDIEWIALEATGLRHGQVVAFEIRGEQEMAAIYVLVQHRPDPPLRRRIVEALSARLGISCEVAFVPQSFIPLTSSGKLQRSRAREIWTRDSDSRGVEFG